MSEVRKFRATQDPEIGFNCEYLSGYFTAYESVNFIEERAYDSLAAELEQVKKDKAEAVKALEEIANQDYRGNRSRESVIAYKALKTIRGRDEL